MHIKTPGVVMMVLLGSYLLLQVFAGFTELFFINTVVDDLSTTLNLAAKTSISQYLSSDDFFAPEQQDHEYSIKMVNNSGSGYVDVPLFRTLTGKTVKEEMFKSVNKNLKGFITNNPKVLQIQSAVAIPGQANQYGYIPTITAVGSELIGSEYNSLKAKNGAVYTNALKESVYDELGLSDVQHRTSELDYYNSPIRLGITYLDPEILGKLYAANVEMLMRSKYIANGTALNTPEGGEGILNPETRQIKTLNPSANPINNGLWTFLRGDYETVEDIKAYKGIAPKIEYKIIDIYNPINDSALQLTTGKTSDYYKGLGELDQATRLPKTEKYAVLAKVTFYADIIVPYHSKLLRYQSEMVNKGSDFVAIKRSNTGVKSTLGNDSELYEITKLVLVLP